MFIFLTFFFAFTTFVCGFYMLRFAKIILSIQNAISDTLEALDVSFEEITNFLKMTMAFDAPEVQKKIVDALDSIKAVKVMVGVLIDKFTKMSKRKYIEEVQEDDET